MDIEKYRSNFNEIIEKCKNDISVIRAARATPILVENILIEVYGTKTPLQQLANINIPDPKTILISPWDKNIVKNIEDAIRNSDLNLNPVNEGDKIRLVLPQLTEERRLELVKTLKQKLEQYRIRLRQLRDQIKEEIIDMEKQKQISEDEKYRLLEKLDKMTSEFNDKIKEIGEDKEKEIMTI